MPKNQNIDSEAVDFRMEEEVRVSFTEEEYLIAVLNSVSATILSDDFYKRNKQLIRNVSNDFHDRHNRRGDMPPNLAGRAMEILFSSITKIGWR